MPIQASSFTSVSGLATEPCADTNGGFDVGSADGGDYAVYDGIDFGAGAHRVDVRVASGGSGGTLEFRLDSATGPVVGSIVVRGTGGWQQWTTVSAIATGAAGVHRVYMVFAGGAGIGNVNWFRFQ
jgi:hypothetical protein